MNVNYKHTQTGILTLILMPIIALVIIGVASIEGWSWIPILVLGVITIVAILFGKLTIEVRDGWLQFWFGPGFIRQKFFLSEVVEAVALKNPWYYGWGIHWTPQGWLFNVSGFDAVEITLASGKHFKIGTDQPQTLEAVIRQGAGLTTVDRKK